MNGRLVGIILALMLALFLNGQAWAVTTGTADGTYDFGSLGAADSAGTSYTMLGDKFKAANSEFTQSNSYNTGPLTAIYPTTGSAPSYTAIIKAEGGSTCKTFTFKDLGVSAYVASQTFNSLDIVLKDINGVQIGSTISLGSSGTLSNTSVTNISTLYSHAAWSVDNVAAIEITYTIYVGGSPDAAFDLSLENITIANVSAPVAAPVVYSASPSYGMATGGSSVVITGGGFTGATAVKFGSTAATSYTVDSATQITAIAPAGTLGTTVDITVTTPLGTNTISTADRFIYTTNTLGTADGTYNFGGLGATDSAGTGYVKLGDKFKVGNTQFLQWKSFNVGPQTAIYPGTGTISSATAVIMAEGGATCKTFTFKDLGISAYVASQTFNSLDIVLKDINGVQIGSTISLGSSGTLSSTSVTNISTLYSHAAWSVDNVAAIEITYTLSANGSPITSDNLMFENISIANVTAPTGAPGIISTSPSYGPIAGGGTIIITGAGFTGATAVKFGSTPATSYTVNSDIQITAIAPAGLLGTTIDITVTTPLGTNTTSAADQFIYTTNTLGTADGLYNFGGLGTADSAGAGYAKLGDKFKVGNTLFTQSNSYNTGPKTAVYPSTGTTSSYTAVIKAEGGSTCKTFTFKDLEISAYKASQIFNSLEIVLKDVNGVQIGSTISLGSSGTISTTSVTNISTLYSHAAWSVDNVAAVEITYTLSASGSPVTSDNLNFENITIANVSNVIAAPTVTGISPSSGPTAGGTSVTITGTSLIVATVKFGSTSATIASGSATSITATSPAGAAGTVHVTVTTAGGTSATSVSDQFTYVAAPTVSAVSLASGPIAGGTSVTITGTNLTGATSVRFGGTSATGVTVDSATQITATVPTGSAGMVDITVTTAGGTSATSANDHFTYVAAPMVTAVSPTSGPAAGGTGVTITGTNLTGATAVKFGSVNTTITANTATSIMATAPPGSAGTVDITVTTAGGTSATSASDQFAYVAAPTVTTTSVATSALTSATMGGNVIAANGAIVTERGVVYSSTDATPTIGEPGVTQDANGSGTGSFSKSISSLSAGTTYYVSAYATNSIGTSYGSVASFTTSTSAPTATTGAAGSPTATRATLNGTISSNGASTTVSFEYGLTTSYGVSAPVAPLTAGASGIRVSATISGLTCNTTYHFRVTGANSAGTTNGSDAVLTTSACAPIATTGAVSGVTATGVTLNGTISDNGATTTVGFNYGLTTSYGSTATATPGSVSAGAGSSAVSATINSLSCNTLYHFRVTGANSAGTTNGSDATFISGACVPGAPTMGSANPGDSQATVIFTTPASNGGANITGYTVTANPGGATGTGASSPITVTNLTNGISYTFTVTATNSAGTGAASAASTSVTPNPGPSVVSVAVPASGTYKTGSNLDFTVTWGSTVTVTGTPRMALVIGASVVYATYVSSPTATTTLFRYTVLAGQADTDGIAISALTLNGGTIRNTNDTEATLTLNSVGNTAAVLVDTAAPTLPAANIVINNQSDPQRIVLTFSKALNGTTLGVPSAWTATANGGTPAYSVAAVALTGTNQVSLTLGAVDVTNAATFITNSAASAHLQITPPATLAESAGNTYAAGQVTEMGATHILDTTPPTLAGVGTNGATSSGGTVSATASEKAKGYWIAVAEGATAPTVAQVKAGVAYGSIPVVAGGNGALPSGAAGSIAVSGLAPSTAYELYLVAEDAAGNATATVSKTAIATTAALKVSTLPDGAVTTDTTLNVSGTAGNPVNLKALTINGTAITVAGDGSFSYPVQLVAGANIITVVATGTGGTTTDTRTITLDSTALHLAVTYPPDNKALTQQAVTVTGSIAELFASTTVAMATDKTAAITADPTMVVSYSINGGTSQAATLTDATYSFTANLSAGMNTIQISAVNGAGKTAQAKRTVTYQPAFSLAVSDPASDIRTLQTSYLLQGVVADNSTPVSVVITMGTQTYTPVVNADTGAFQQMLTFGGNRVYQVNVMAMDQNSATLTVPRNIVTEGATAGAAFTVADALQALKMSVGLAAQEQSQILRLDVAPLVNGVSVGDGKVDIEDVIVVLRKAVGLL